MYPYHLGMHLKTMKFCRIPHPAWGLGIPQGFGRVIRFKQKRPVIGLYQRYDVPYRTTDGPDKGELKPEYWSIKRWTDIQKELGEPLTGPKMLTLLTYNCVAYYDEREK